MRSFSSMGSFARRSRMARLLSMIFTKSKVIVFLQEPARELLPLRGKSMFLDDALEHGLRVMVDVPWEKHRCFFEDSSSQQDALRRVRETALAILDGGKDAAVMQVLGMKAESISGHPCTLSCRSF